MKKIMIAAVAVALAAVAQAASFNWSCTGSKTVGTIYDFAGNKLASGAMAVLIDAGVTSQATLLAAAREDGFNLASYGIAGSSAEVNSSSKITKTGDFTYGAEGGSYNFYFAILDSANDQLLISSVEADQPGLGVGAQTVAFGSAAATFSKNALGDADYSAAGWYSTAAVPEPTSGLLLLLGMAGLALRRKQA